MIHENNFVDEPVFDPKIHLAYSPPTQKFTLEDLKLPRSETSSDIAGTTPFPILSPEGVRAYRRALFTPSILQQCASNPFPGTLILRNAADHSTFINDFWTHPTTMRLISEAAGLPLSIVMRTEIGHTNIQASGDSVEEMIAGLTPEPSMTKVPLTEEEKRYDPLGTNSIIPWHYDSYPYVCVLMLSDTEGMLGGETYIKGGDGVPVKVAGPALGHGVLLQGGEVQHLAARAIGVKERITTITSYCAKVEGLYDSSYISNIRPYCDRNVLYKQWAQFRLEKMQAEISVLQRQLSQSQGPVDVSQINRFVDKQVSYMKRTARQLIPQDEYDAIYKRFGKDTIQNAHRLWKKAEDHPDFNKRIVAIDQSNWMPESPLWADLAETQITVRLGKVLQAQQGRYKWEKARGFVMGDELLRQGLPEIFLLWLDATGLYSVVTSEESVQVVKGSGFASVLLGYFGGALRALRKAFVW